MKHLKRKLTRFVFFVALIVLITKLLWPLWLHKKEQEKQQKAKPPITLSLPSVSALQKGVVTGNTLDVHILSVRQGNCILVKYPNNEFMLVDCGTSSSGVNPTDINNYINYITAGKKIATVVLTHPDKDHISFIKNIDAAANPKFVHISGVAGDYSLISSWISKVASKIKIYPSNYTNSSSLASHFGADSTIPGLHTDVYVLAANVTGDVNTSSIVLAIKFNGSVVLLTGDATMTTEKHILSTFGTALKSTLFFFGHHGSSHSSSNDFLNAVKPNIGIFSASAEHMGYGHPRCELLNAVQTMLDENGIAGVKIPMHRIDCWDSFNRYYATEKNDLGIFLTAVQGNMLFKADGINYEVMVTKLTAPAKNDPFFKDNEEVALNK